MEGKSFERGHGDRLKDAQWRKLQTATFYGNDVDPKMVSLASMNLALRGLPDVRILKRISRVAIQRYLVSNVRTDNGVWTFNAPNLSYCPLHHIIAEGDVPGKDEWPFNCEGALSTLSPLIF